MAWGGGAEEFHDILRLRDEFNSGEETFSELFGINQVQFENLYVMLRPIIHNRHILLHQKAIRPRDQIALFLRFMVAGKCYGYHSSNYDLPLVIVSSIVDKIAELILQRFQPLAMPTPSKRLWEDVTAGFMRVHKMPHCLGSVYGRFLNIVNVGIRVLLLLINADQKFVIVDVGDYDTLPERIWDNSELGSRFEYGAFELPTEPNLGEYEKYLPYVLIAGDSFPQKRYMLTKFRDPDDDARKVFDYRIDFMKTSAEEAVTRLRRRWQFIQSPISVPMPKVQDFIKAACCLENYFTPLPI